MAHSEWMWSNTSSSSAGRAGRRSGAVRCGWRSTPRPEPAMAGLAAAPARWAGTRGAPVLHGCGDVLMAVPVREVVRWVGERQEDGRAPTHHGTS
ncbi:hypothetical protein GCM10009634_37520 [Saccharothrix xinjiangensis]